MDDRSERKARRLELIQNNKNLRKPELDPLLKECIESLQPDVEVLSEEESEHMYGDLQDKFPFVSWGRIDWESLKERIPIANLSDILYFLNKTYQTRKYTVYVLWGYTSGHSPVIKTNLKNAIRNIEDINAVGCDQWLYCPSHKFVIEFYHEGEIMIGFKS